MKKRVAYLMHVDWNWIKQRPHFIAEGLLKYYDIDLFFIRNYSVKGLMSNEISNAFCSCNVIRKVPYSSRNKLLLGLEHLVNNSVLKNLYAESYDYIFILSPIILQFVDINRLKGKIIYDCMDDYIAFQKDTRNKNYMFQLEKELLKHSDFVFASAQGLADIIKDRGYDKNVYLVNNGVDASMLNRIPNKSEPLSNKTNFNIFYFGTISEWFDSDTIIKVLDAIPDVAFTLIGPCHIELPAHERLRHLGPVKHNELTDAVKDADAFIMPFILNNIVKVVDPVKVYEYIAFLKPVFVRQYQETVKFRDYVWMYDNFSELCMQINKAKVNNESEIDISRVKEFINQNSWDARASRIYEILEQDKV